MASRHTFDIFLPTQAIGARVLINGQEVKGVTGVGVSGYVNGLTSVVLTLLPESVRVHGETEQLAKYEGDPFDDGTTLEQRKAIIRDAVQPFPPRTGKRGSF